MKTIKYHYKFIRMAEIQKTECQLPARMQSKRNSYSLLVRMQNGTTTLEDWWFILSLNLVLPDDPAIIYLSVYPTDLKAYVHTNSCTLIFIAVVITIAKDWKQPKMEYFPFIKKKVCNIKAHEDTDES